MTAPFMFASSKARRRRTFLQDLLANKGVATYSMNMTRAYTIALFAILPIASCATSPLLIDALSVPDDYRLVWSDEFEQDGLPNPANWAYDTYRNKQGWWNKELQYYADARAKNARIENGSLIIEVHAETLASDTHPDWGGQDYTSARLFTKGKASWQYGYIEVRAKLPCGRGLWPAIWTLPEQPGRWPDSGEIDIMEYVGWDADTFYATVHTGAYNHTLGTHSGATYTSPTACGGFHTHILHWTPDEILVGVDGTRYFSYPNTGEGEAGWPFDRPHHLILNIAIGGWGGREGIDPAAFPAQMLIDYVRVYQANTPTD